MSEATTEHPPCRIVGLEVLFLQTGQKHKEAFCLFVCRGSQFGCWLLLIGWSFWDGCGLTPQPETADSSIWADDETNVSDGFTQRQRRSAVQVTVMGAELQEDRKQVKHSLRLNRGEH